MSNPEGSLQFLLKWQGNRVEVSQASHRPVMASSIFEHQSSSDALARIPLLFNICGQAQSVAAIRAIESFNEQFAANVVEVQRDLLVAFESLREHLWRVLIDWPTLLNVAPRTAEFAPLHQQMLAIQKAINAAGELTRAPGLNVVKTDLSSLSESWKTLRISIETILGNSEASDDTAISLHLLEQLKQQPWCNVGDYALDTLPDMSSTELLAAFHSGDEFVATPVWAGKVYETGPFARQKNHPLLIQTREQHGQGIYTRMVARLLEVNQLLDFISGVIHRHRPARSPQGENGIAQIEAVRGRLIHAIELEGDIISRYRILAPTEWNFHPDGIAMHMLSGLDNEAELQTQASWVIQAIDPCVGYDVTVTGMPDGINA